jgi:hypothetical protein
VSGECLEFVSLPSLISGLISSRTSFTVFIWMYTILIYIYKDLGRIVVKLLSSESRLFLRDPGHSVTVEQVYGRESKFHKDKESLFSR